MHMRIQTQPFGVTADGEPVTRYLMTDGPYAVAILNYGGVIQALQVPDRQGNPMDIVLGFDTIAAYEAQDKYIGALVGRCANRIAGGRFTLNGHTYSLPQNNEQNHLHGGGGFSTRVWQAEPVQDGLRLRLYSPEGDAGYPGALDVTVTYMLHAGTFVIAYHAVSDMDTLCNLTNHTYFNLAGHASGPVLNQQIQLHATRYTPANAQSIPTGEIAPVAGTPMDLRTMQPIGAGIDAVFEPLQFAGGYDHNWIIDGTPGTLRPAAQAYSEKTGIRMEMHTTMPGLQFYTGNFLDGCPAGKGGAPYDKRWGFCLETQFYPDAIHHPHFPQAILRAGEPYAHRTVFRFQTDS